MGVKNAPRLHVAGPALIHAGVRDYAARRRPAAVSYSYTYDMPVFQRRRRVEATPTPQTPTEAEDLANIDTVRGDEVMNE